MSNLTDPLVIVAARRTPQGKFMGKLANYSSLDLALAAGRAVLESIPADAIDLTVMGNCLPPVLNVARQLSLKLEIPESSPGYTVNMACASGLHAVTLGADAIRLGRAKTVLCGGTESMTNAPHFVPKSRSGFRLGDVKMVDSLLLGLSDPVINESMAQTAQRLAEKHSITREEQDRFSERSHHLAAQAQRNKIFQDELVPLPELAEDEHVRADTSMERLGTLNPVLGAGSSITAGNASGINDGAALVVLTTLSHAEKNGWKPLATLTHYTSVGCSPHTMGIGPVHAIQKLTAETNQSLQNFDTIEINEAFAAQAIACTRELAFDAHDSRFNKNGSGIALGHPIGASGARLLVHLANQIKNGAAENALASLCVGGGMGIAATLTAPNP